MLSSTIRYLLKTANTRYQGVVKAADWFSIIHKPVFIIICNLPNQTIGPQIIQNTFNSNVIFHDILVPTYLKIDKRDAVLKKIFFTVNFFFGTLPHPRSNMI